VEESSSVGYCTKDDSGEIPGKFRESKASLAKVLKLNIMTAGDWIKVKRIEKNLTLCHVAAKMGIATSLVCSWESSTRQPDSQQLEVLSSVLGFDAKDFETQTSNLPCRALENQT
jgi:DNA-binding transcriptional regulator YiaG